eukprot:6589015-Heterocapsa_arctica.AAC.1
MSAMTCSSDSTTFTFDGTPPRAVGNSGMSKSSSPNRARRSSRCFTMLQYGHGLSRCSTLSSPQRHPHVRVTPQA